MEDDLTQAFPSSTAVRKSNIIRPESDEEVNLGQNERERRIFARALLNNTSTQAASTAIRQRVYFPEEAKVTLGMTRPSLNLSPRQQNLSASLAPPSAAASSTEVRPKPTDPYATTRLAYEVPWNLAKEAVLAPLESSRRVMHDIGTTIGANKDLPQADIGDFATIGLTASPLLKAGARKVIGEVATRVINPKGSFELQQQLGSVMEEFQKDVGATKRSQLEKLYSRSENPAVSWSGTALQKLRAADPVQFAQWAYQRTKENKPLYELGPPNNVSSIQDVLWRKIMGLKPFRETPLAEFNDPAKMYWFKKDVPQGISAVETLPVGSHPTRRVHDPVMGGYELTKGSRGWAKAKDRWDLITGDEGKVISQYLGRAIKKHFGMKSDLPVGTYGGDYAPGGYYSSDLKSAVVRYMADKLTTPYTLEQGFPFAYRDYSNFAPPYLRFLMKKGTDEERRTASIHLRKQPHEVIKQMEGSGSKEEQALASDVLEARKALPELSKQYVDSKRRQAMAELEADEARKDWRATYSQGINPYAETETEGKAKIAYLKIQDKYNDMSHQHLLLSRKIAHVIDRAGVDYANYVDTRDLGGPMIPEESLRKATEQLKMSLMNKWKPTQLGAP